MSQPSYTELLQLSAEERRRLAEFLWDSLEDSPDILPLSDAQRKVLDERLRTFYSNKSQSLPWGVVKEQILSGR